MNYLLGWGISLIYNSQYPGVLTTHYPPHQIKQSAHRKIGTLQNWPIFAS